MCGIIAYKGKKEPFNILLNGLKNLEYRGYDSWGTAVLNNNNFEVLKDVGKVENVNIEKNYQNSDRSCLGIGHTRWATTGKVNQENAHPHLSNNKQFVIVHNGIVENYQEIKLSLLKKNYSFSSETDSEVVVNLIEDFYLNGNDFLEAVRLAALEMVGRNSFVVMKKDSNQIIGVRNGSPLIVGNGGEELFLGSDVLAFGDCVRDIVYMNDGEMVTLNNGLHFFDLRSLDPIEKVQSVIDWDLAKAEKDGFDHFMQKEIYEQGHVLTRTLNRSDEEFHVMIDLIKKSRKIVCIGAGTAGKVALFGQYFFAKVANKEVQYISASEFKHFSTFYNNEDLMIVISQSGETADCLQAIEIAENQGMKIASIVNVMGSSIYRKSANALLLNIGVEKAVASTKATTSQMVLVALLAYGYIGKLDFGREMMEKLISSIQRWLDTCDKGPVLSIAKKLSDRKDMYIIGRGLNYPFALESSIKLQEVSYIFAQGFAGAELKHGPIALIETGTPLIVLCSDDDENSHIISNALEVKSRGGYIIGISSKNNPVFDEYISVDDVGDMSCVMNLIPIQLLSYYLSVLRGNDPDKPRNLAKSVTVL